MDFSQFLDMPKKTILEIIGKCYPIPYVRLRRTCRFMDQFCEQNQKYIGIYNYRKDPHLLLLTPIYFNSSNSKKRLLYTRLPIDAFYLAVNYGKRNNYYNFTARMTPDNIGLIKRSLSGFAFTHASIEQNMMAAELVNDNGSVDYQELRTKFDEAVKWFIEATAEFKIRNLTLESLVKEQVERLTNTWNVDELTICSCGTIRELLALKGVKKVKSISAEIFDEDICEELVRGDRFVKGYFHCSETAPLSIVKKITKNWEEGAEEDEAIELNSSEILYGREVIYKWEVWMGKVAGGDAKWQIISMRTHLESYTHCTIETAMTRADFHSKLVNLLGNIHCRSAFDFSKFHGALEQMDSLEGIKDVFYEMGNFIGTFLA